MSNELAKLPTMLADAQVARWRSKYGRDPTDQQRSWLVNKIRTNLAMNLKGVKLNARVLTKNLRKCMTSPFPQEREGRWILNTKTGLACNAEDHTQADTTIASESSVSRQVLARRGVADVVESKAGRGPPRAEAAERSTRRRSGAT